MSIVVAPPPTVPRPGRAAANGRPVAAPALPARFARSKCGRCIALCCRYFAMEVDRPTTPRDFDDLRWFMLHERVQIFTEGRKWFVQVFNRCTALGPDNLCTIYDHRPVICREYDNDWCDKDEQESDPNEGNDHVFHTLEELEAYRARWVKRYEAARRRTRRKAAQKAARTRRRRR
jgi:Fe-S-cluster containining protein